MWNGFLKLTVMVGVIGVGLFAAYQAQKGMSRSASTVPDETRAEQGESPNERVLAADSTSTDRTAITFDEFGASKKSKKKRPKPVDPEDEDIKLVNNVESEQSDVQSALDPRESTKRQSVSNRATDRKGANRQNNDSTDETPKDNVEAPAELPDDEFADPEPRLKKSTPNKAARDFSFDLAEKEKPSKVDSVLEENAAPETSVDPFGNDTAAPATDSSTEVAQTADDQPGRAQIKSDDSNDADIPRSRRAIVGSSRRSESPVEDEAEIDPFAEKVKSVKARADAGASEQPSTRIKSRAASASVEESAESDSLFQQESFPTSAPRSLPSAAQELPQEDVQPSRAVNNRQVMPADLDSESVDSPPPRLPAPQNRRAIQDAVTPVDLVGDGEVGNVNQRGIQQPRLTIEKIAQQQAVLDQPLVYSIIVRNLGSVDAHNVVIEDRIPKGSELVGTSPRAELAGKRLIWNEPLLKPNEEKKISIKVIPKQEGPIGSVARVYFATEVSAEIQVAAPQLDFTVKAPREVRIGQKFDMTFNLKNIGRVDANNITVRDIVPDNLKHEAGLDIECPIGKLAPNEIREIVLPVVAIKTGSVVNRAILILDNVVKKELPSEIDIVGESLVLTRTGHNRLYVERTAVFTNSIRNEGNQTASKVRISEVVPAGMEFETASDGGKYDANLRAVVWILGPLDPGTDKAVTVKYVPKAIGTLDGQITATGSFGSTAAVKSTVEVIGKPELQMETLSATGSVTVGEQITSKFQLKNSGTAAAQNVQLKIRLPRELRLVKVRGANFQQKDDYILFEPIVELAPRAVAGVELILEPINEADARIGLEISANHLTKPHRREETIQIARDQLR